MHVVTKKIFHNFELTGITNDNKHNKFHLAPRLLSLDQNEAKNSSITILRNAVDIIL